MLNMALAPVFVVLAGRALAVKNSDLESISSEKMRAVLSGIPASLKPFQIVDVEPGYF
jgi:hypothetical protein